MSESIVRAISGILYIAILISAIFYNEYSFKILFCVFMILASNEFSKMINFPKTYALIISILASFFALYLPHNYLIFSLFSIPFLFYLTYKLFTLGKYTYQNTLIKTIFLLGYIIFPFLCISQLIYFPEEYFPPIVLSYLIIIWVNDTFAYICGKLLGKHKLFEKISPKKTIEGFAGGIIFSMITGIILNNFIKYYDIIYWVIIAFSISILSTIGDLIESKFKREAQIKDSGNLIPGHGGILDRLDSFIFVAPFLLLINKILIYVS